MITLYKQREREREKYIYIEIEKLEKMKQPDDAKPAASLKVTLQAAGQRLRTTTAKVHRGHSKKGRL